MISSCDFYPSKGFPYGVFFVCCFLLRDWVDRLIGGLLIGRSFIASKFIINLGDLGFFSNVEYREDQIFQTLEHVAWRFAHPLITRHRN